MPRLTRRTNGGLLGDRQRYMTAMEGIPNFRGLCGLPAADGAQVRPGVMYRSGHLADSTDADRERLQELGIKTVVDLRTDGDIDSDGHDVVPDGIRHVRVPIHDDAVQGEEIRHHVFDADMDEVRAAWKAASADGGKRIVS